MSWYVRCNAFRNTKGAALTPSTTFPPNYVVDTTIHKMLISLDLGKVVDTEFEKSLFLRGKSRVELRNSIRTS